MDITKSMDEGIERSEVVVEKEEEKKKGWSDEDKRRRLIFLCTGAI